MQTRLINTDHLIAFLRTTPLFAQVDVTVVQEIAPRLQYLRCEPGQVVIRAGERGDALYLVLRGQLRAVARRPDGTEVLLNTIEAGEGVGELALLTGERRTATVYATAEAELVRLSREDFELLGQRYPDTLREIVQVIVRRLQQTQLNLALHVGKLIDQLAEPVLRALQAELDLVVVHGGEVVVREGEPSDALYVVINGRLRVVREQADGGATTLRELRRGQTVGEIGILTGAARTATVYAVRDSLLARLSRAAFDRLLVAYPQAMVRQFAAPAITALQEQINHARRPDEEVATIAVVPINAHESLPAFAAQLAEALAVAGPTLHLSSTSLEQWLTKRGIAQTPRGAPAGSALVGWLNEQEARYRYIVYEADPDASPWTERCLRQADRILLVANAGDSPAQSALERALLTDDARLAAQRSLALVHPPDTRRPVGTRRWLEARPLSAHYHVRRDNRTDMARLGRLLTGRGIGVVLSGGGAAGFGHLGALRALREAGIPIDLIGGTSQGGLMACQYAMGWDDATLVAKNRAAISHRFDYTFPITALMAGAEMTEVVQEMFGDAQLEDMWIPCFCITTNLSRATMMVHDRGPAWKYTRATTSLPGVLPPVIVDGEMLLDGGLLNNLPTDVMRERGDCGVVIACDVASAIGAVRGHNPPYESSISGWKVLWRRLNPFSTPLKVPTIGQIMTRVAVINDAQRVQTARELADFYLRLDLRRYGILEFGALEQIVAAGYQAAQQTVATWRDDAQFQALQRLGRAQEREDRHPTVVT
jgi:predicted acylesterase/phospholipase RssA/CRP-like cAMP-binding protein